MRALTAGCHSSHGIVGFGGTFFMRTTRRRCGRLTRAVPRATGRLLATCTSMGRRIPRGGGIRKCIRIQLLGARRRGSRGSTRGGRSHVVRLYLRAMSRLATHNIPARHVTVLIHGGHAVRSVTTCFVRRSSCRVISSRTFHLSTSRTMRVLVATLGLLVRPTSSVSHTALLGFTRACLSSRGIIRLVARGQRGLLRVPLLSLARELFARLRLNRVRSVGMRDTCMYTFCSGLGSFLASGDDSVRTFLRR